MSWENNENTKNPITISYKLSHITDVMKQTVIDTVQKNLKNKMDAYFQRIIGKKTDATIRIDVAIDRNKQSHYDGKFHFLLDGVLYYYHTSASNPFKNVRDLINHAFDHCKIQLATK